MFTRFILILALLPALAFGAISFNGSSQYVSTTDSAAYPSSGQNFLLSAWVKTSTTPASTNRAVVGWAENGVNDSVCGIRMNTSGQLGIAITRDGGSVAQSYVSINAADGNWHFVVMWWDQATLTLSGLVDNAASPVTRTLTAGQTITLSRLTAGVQIRSAVDATTYWTGELAEVVFMRGGTYTEAHARALYNIGFPKRGQVPGTAQARWPFETDANAAGGSGPDLTATGSPTYNDNEDTLFALIDAYTPVTLSESNAAVIEEGDLDSGTSHYVRVTTPSAGHMAVGWVRDLTDGVSSGQDMVQWAPFAAPETRGTTDPFANKLSDYVENNFRFLTVPSAGDWMVRVFQPAGSTAVIRGVSVRFDGTNGVVPMYGANFHCWPTSLVYGGSVFRIVRGLDSRAALAVTKDGVVIYNSDALARVNAGDDTYHSGACLVATPNGVALVSVAHNGAMEIAWAAGGNFTNAVTWTKVQIPSEGSDNGDNTYCMAVYGADGLVHIFNRGTYDSAATNPGYPLQHWMIEDIETTPAVTTDLLGGDGTRQYPNSIYQVGSLIFISWTGAWNYGFTAIYNTSTGLFTDFVGNQMGSSGAGTVASPRFGADTSDEWTTAMTAGTGLRIHGGSGSNYNAAGLFTDGGNFPTTPAGGAFIFSQTAGALNELAATTITYVVQLGANKYVGGVDFTQPTEWTCNYWRIFAAMQWLDNDPDTNVALLFLIDHDDREAGGRYDTALPTGYTPYYDMGGRRYRVYRITNPISASPTFELVTDNAPTITDGLTGGYVRSVPGRPNVFRLEESNDETELHEVKRQARFFEWEYVPPPEVNLGVGFW